MSIAYMKRGDTSPSWDILCLDDDGNAVNVEGASVQFHARLAGSDTLKVDSAGSVVDGAAGHVRYEPTSSDTDTVGLYEVEVEMTFSDGSIETFPNSTSLQILIIDDID